MFTLSADGRRVPSINWFQMKGLNSAHYNDAQQTYGNNSTSPSNKSIATVCVGCVDTIQAAATLQNDARDNALPSPGVSHTRAEAQSQLQSILRQLLSALATLHAHNITHRDIKPQNILLWHKSVVDAADVHLHTLPAHEMDIMSAYVRICDFGAAIDPTSLRSRLLYPFFNFTLELASTREYEPPETIFHGLQHDLQTPVGAYDMWSAGVVILELITASHNIYHIDSRARGIIDNKLRDAPEQLRQNAYMLRALIDMCVYTSSSSSVNSHHQQSENAISIAECNDSHFAAYVRKLDITGQGFDDVRLLRLVRSMLQWKPEDRITSAAALESEYFAT